MIAFLSLSCTFSFSPSFLFSVSSANRQSIEIYRIINVFKNEARNDVFLRL